MVFYRSFFESVEDLEPEEFKRCVSSILQYGLDGIEPDVEGISKTVFKLVKPQIDKNNQRYLNGLKGGKPKDNQNVTKLKPNVNVNVNDNVNDLYKRKSAKKNTFISAMDMKHNYNHDNEEELLKG